MKSGAYIAGGVLILVILIAFFVMRGGDSSEAPPLSLLQKTNSPKSRKRLGKLKDIASITDPMVTTVSRSVVQS